MRLITGLGIAALSALVAAVPLAAEPVYVTADGVALLIKPHQLHLISNENLFHLRWRTWGGKTASASGVDRANFPSQGHRSRNPVRVLATERRLCGSKLVYTTIRLHFTHGVPYAGQPRRTKYAYGCPSDGQG